MRPGSPAFVATSSDLGSCLFDVPGEGPRIFASAESQGCGLCVFAVGHISFRTQGEEIADELADPAFFQKVVTLASGEGVETGKLQRPTG